MSWVAPRPVWCRGIVAVALAVSLAACSQSALVPNAAVALAADSPVIAFLMPDQASTRYERYDYPLFHARVDNLCVRCEVVYSNAEASGDKQREQALAALDRGASVLVMSAVEPRIAADIVRTAHERGAQVVAYDRPIDGADYYISFDNFHVGELQGQMIVDGLDKAGVDPASASVVYVGGDPTPSDTYRAGYLVEIAADGGDGDGDGDGGGTVIPLPAAVYAFPLGAAVVGLYHRRMRRQA